MAALSSKAQQELTSIRDTVESIWVAIVLAFVLRAFVVEAFVIPTGSMAPRLLGKHLDLQCPACGKDYAFGWPSDQSAASRPMWTRCPSCGHTRPPSGEIAAGDRVLVMKYLYRFREPEPWDVVVFKNPQDNRQNYIKRLIGLPGEQIEIVHGDIFVRRPGEKHFRIRRKPSKRTQDAMWQIVFDNDFRPRMELVSTTETDEDAADHVGPPSWAPADRWDLSAYHGRRFVFQGSPPDQEAELTFRGGPDVFHARYGYNAGSDTVLSGDGEAVVSDLNLSATFFPGDPGSRLALTLSSFEHVFRGEVSADGTARLLYRRTDDPNSTAWTPLAPEVKRPPLRAGRGYEVSLTHVDFRVTLWVNGKGVLVSRDREPDDLSDDRTEYPLNYRLLKERLAKATAEPPLELPRPAAKIAAAGGRCELWHVRLMRDLHYTQSKLTERQGIPTGSAGNFARDLGIRSGQPSWASKDHPITLAKYDDRPDLNQYFVLGDNSPSSLDGRLWVSAAATLRLYDKTGALGDPRLGVGDVRWRRLVRAIRRGMRAGEPSPARRIVSLLGEPLRKQIEALNPADLANGYLPTDLKYEVVDALNATLAAKAFYDPKLWQAAAAKLPARGQELAERHAAGQELTAAERMDLNRLALEAALAETINPRRRIYQLGTVPRYSLIGKAIFVYWPAGFRIPGLAGLPIIPNAGKMRLIR